MKIMVLGAGHVAQALVHALHEDHEITVIDIDPQRLAALSSRYDVRAVEGDGTTKHVVLKAGVEQCDLFVGCSPREEANLVCAMLVKRMSKAQTIIRTTSAAYLEAWRERQLDVDFMVSPELETANAISAILGIPAARHTDVFADGKVQIVEFDVAANANRSALIGRPLRDAEIPRDSKVAGLIRGDRMIVPRGDEQVLPGDRVVVIASPASARAWCRVTGRTDERVDDVVIFGAGRMGTTIARVLLDRGIRLRLVDAQLDRVREVAEALPQVRAFHAHAFDPEFLERERIGRTAAAVFCLNDDARNLYGAVLAKGHGVRLTIALVHDEISIDVYERGGVDVAINPRQVTAEELVRFAHDPRIRQIAMLEDDRFEILDLTVRPESTLVDKPFKELPATGSLIGAVIRNGSVLFPHSSDILRAGDRVIIFVESRRASLVERAL
ncbi:MAG TPA: Trk system potassium transporter TrkA [Solirubrobacteraceae bacterium]|nr:Trk system potassium transporter TrkA [Solirubrobacteraceae bacterium]